MEIYVFNILRYILLILFIIVGYYQSIKSNKSYWKLATIPIIFYSLMEGLRWNRGKDYLNYYYLVVNDQTTGDLLFDFSGQIVSYLDLHFSFFFILQSFIVIYCLYYFLRDYRKSIVPCIVLMYAFSMGQSENLVRQYCAMSLFLVVIRLLEQKRLIATTVCVICSLFIHKSVIFAYCFLTLFYIITNKTSFSSKFIFTCCIVFLTLFLIAPVIRASFMKIAAPLLPYIEMVSGKYGTSNYLERALESGNWFNYSFEFIYYLREYLRAIVVIIGGAFMARIINPVYKRCYFICYGLACSGLIYNASIPELNMEVIWRLGLYLLWLVYFMEGIIIYYSLSSKRNLAMVVPKFSLLWGAIVFVLFVLECIWIFKPQLGTELGLKFIWDI